MTKAYFILRSTNKVIDSFTFGIMEGRWGLLNPIRGDWFYMHQKLKALIKQHKADIYINFCSSA